MFVFVHVRANTNEHQCSLYTCSCSFIPGYQHFIIEEPENGIPRMTKLKNLNVGLQNPSCTTFQITSQYFPWSEKTIVILCFGYNHNQSCYSFDEKLEHASDTYLSHYRGGIANYRRSLLTVAGINPNAGSFSDVYGSQITEVGFELITAHIYSTGLEIETEVSINPL